MHRLAAAWRTWSRHNGIDASALSSDLHAPRLGLAFFTSIRVPIARRRVRFSSPRRTLAGGLLRVVLLDVARMPLRYSSSST